MKMIVPVLGAVAVSCAAVAFAAPPAPMPPPAAAPQAMDSHPVNQLSDIKWGPAPPALPPGAQVMVMAGDPSAKGFISLRAKMPAGYKVPPHWHPTDEHVTVLSGTMLFGDGDEMDPKKARTVKTGGYFTAGAQMHHYAIAKTAAVIQVDMVGPFEITYINPADDPRTKAK
jgi:quercetin dioxygenase-like cupin family protein